MQAAMTLLHSIVFTKELDFLENLSDTASGDELEQDSYI